jgi:hypothetical protein
LVYHITKTIFEGIKEYRQQDYTLTNNFGFIEVNDCILFILNIVLVIFKGWLHGGIGRHAGL